MIDSDACVIPLGKNGKCEALVSQQDYAALTAHRWNYKVSAWKYGGKLYARRGGGRASDGKLRPTIYMHAYILRVLMGEPQPSPEHTPQHKDGDSLNNCRSNLKWADKAEQSLDQKRRMPQVLRDAIDARRMAA